jgi:hypothetical protein
MSNFNLSKNPVDTVAPSRANQITKEYYDFLVGEINRGTIFRSVCRIEDKRFGSVSYHLISI